MKITILEENTKTALVEWSDANGLHRGYLPRGIIKDDLSAVVLRTAVPFGLNFEDFPVTVNLAKALHDRGIWTINDMNDIANVKAAIQDALGIQLESLLNYARRARQEAP